MMASGVGHEDSVRRLLQQMKLLETCDPAPQHGQLIHQLLLGFVLVSTQSRLNLLGRPNLSLPEENAYVEFTGSTATRYISGFLVGDLSFGPFEIYG